VPAIQGDGELACLIRAYDWSNTSIGAIHAWPATLVTIVNMMLQSPVPMVLLWGADGVMLYNDPYSDFAAGRHPTLLGSKVLEGWPEVADFNRHVMEQGLQGKTLSFKDQQLTLYRNRIPEEVWMDLNYSPILDERGQPVGVLAIVVETSEQIKAELALRESELRFRTMSDTAPAMIWMSNAQGELNYRNESFAAFYGLPASSNDVVDWEPLVHPDDLDWVRAIYEEAARDKKAYYLPPHRLKRYDGQYRWLLCNGVPRLTPIGEFLGFTGTVLDITERKQIEESLKESEARFRAMADSAPLFVWTSGPDCNTNYVNKTWRDFLGASPENAASAIMDAMFPEEQAMASSLYRDAFARREPYTMEYRFRRHDGELRWLLTKGSPLFLPDGELAGYIGTSVDITDRKELETQLESNLAHERLIRKIGQVINQSFDIDFILKTVAEEVGRYLNADRSSVSRVSIVDGQVLLNLSAQYVKAGLPPVEAGDIDRITQAARYLAPELMGTEEEQILTVSDPEEYVRLLRVSWAKKIPDGLPGLTIEQLVDMIRKYGVQSSLRANIHYRGTPYGSVSVSQCEYQRAWKPDEVELLKIIAEYAGSAIYQAELYQQAKDTARNEQLARQEMERYASRLEASNKELEQFATIASHDLSEPLRKIHVLTEMVQAKVPEEDRDYFSRIISAATRMRTLMDDLLAFSRINRGTQPFKPVALNDVLSTVLDDLQVAIAETDADIQVLPLPVMDADESQMRQLFQNLISNALKYRRTDVQPRVRVWGGPDEEGYVIRIEDNGIGIQKEYYERIFEPFQRLHGMGQYSGTGMGLAICRKIVARHHGTLCVESEPGQGSQFMMRFPAMVASV